MRSTVRSVFAEAVLDFHRVDADLVLEVSRLSEIISLFILLLFLSLLSLRPDLLEMFFRCGKDGLVSKFDSPPVTESRVMRLPRRRASGCKTQTTETSSIGQRTAVWMCTFLSQRLENFFHKLDFLDHLDRDPKVCSVHFCECWIPHFFQFVSVLERVNMTLRR